MLSSRTSNTKHFHRGFYCNTQACLVSGQRQNTTSKKSIKNSKLLLPSRKRKCNEAIPEVFGKMTATTSPMIFNSVGRILKSEEQGHSGIEDITANDLFPDFCR